MGATIGGAHDGVAVRSEPLNSRERRATARVAYDGQVAIAWLDRSGQPGQAAVFRTLDISFSGISVISRQFVCPGRAGVMQIVRGDGQAALVCVVVATCQAIDSTHYHVGMEFGPLPTETRIEQFQDGSGGLMAMDEAILANVDCG